MYEEIYLLTLKMRNGTISMLIADNNDYLKRMCI